MRLRKDLIMLAAAGWASLSLPWLCPYCGHAGTLGAAPAPAGMPLTCRLWCCPMCCNRFIADHGQVDPLLIRSIRRYPPRAQP